MRNQEKVRDEIDHDTKGGKQINENRREIALDGRKRRAMMLSELRCATDSCAIVARDLVILCLSGLSGTPGFVETKTRV